MQKLTIKHNSFKKFLNVMFYPINIINSPRKRKEIFKRRGDFNKIRSAEGNLSPFPFFSLQ